MRLPSKRFAVYALRTMKTIASSPSKTNPTYRIIEKLSKRWSLLILHAFTQKRTLRFTDILSVLPQINSRILSLRLSELEKEGLIKRSVSEKKPVTITYEVTEKGMDLRRIFESFSVWSRRWSQQKKTVSKTSFFHMLIGG